MTEARYHLVTDLETTGGNSREHEIIQIACTLVDVVERRIVPGSPLSMYVKPRTWRNPAYEINRIDLAMVAKDGISMEAALHHWCTGVDWTQTVVSSWGIDFELKFLRAAFELIRRVRPYPFKGFDVRSAAALAPMRAGNTSFMGLVESARWYGLGVNEDRVHDAAYDVELTVEILLKILEP